MWAAPAAAKKKHDRMVHQQELSEKKHIAKPVQNVLVQERSQKARNIRCSSVATTALNPSGLKSSLGQETLEDEATDGLVRLMTSAMETMGMSREGYLEKAVISFATDCSSMILYRWWQGVSRGEGSQNCARYWALSSATETSVL